MSLADALSLLDDADVGLSVHDEAGALVWSNAAAAGALAAIAELPIEERPISRVLRGEVQGVLRLRVDGAATVVRWTIKTPDGPRVVVSTYQPAAEDDPAEARREVEEAHARLEKITQAVPGVVYQYLQRDDGTEAFPFLAGEVERFLGAKAEDVVRDSSLVWSRVDPEDMPEVQVHMAASRESLSLFDMLLRLKGDDRTRWVRVQSAPEVVPGGILWTGLVLDVTEARELAEALRTAQRREAMGDLAAGLAHNLNNMLAIVLPNVEGARESPEDAPALLADAAVATKRAADLVKQLLYIARGDARRATAAVDLARVVDDVVGLCRRTFDRSIHINLERPEGPAIARGSPAHVEQVVLNLVLNARDALEGMPDPTISVTLSRSEGESYTLEVKDNGAGMPTHVLHRIGDPFFTTKAPGRGTGLGIATVLQTLRDVGGSLDVRSEPGRGATFTVTLPAGA